MSLDVPRPSLRAADLELFERLRVPGELLVASQIRRVTNRQASEEAGITRRGDLEGVYYPNLDPVRRTVRGGRVRRDNPEVGSDGRPKAKYVGPPDRRYLYFPPGAGALLSDVSVPVVIVEAEKSVLAVTAVAGRAGQRLLAIATGGCWGWQGTIGKTTNATGARVDERGPLPDLDRVTWTTRAVVILFDSNVAINAGVQEARKALAKELSNRGARVRLVNVPTEAGVNGPDDFIAQHSDAEFLALLDSVEKVATADTPKQRSPKPKQGREVQFVEPEPWPERVDVGVLLDSLASLFEQYLTLPDHAGTVLALWVLHTYAISAAFTSPIVAITSPTRRCGKTHLLIVLGAVVARRLFASNVTPAALFRIVEKSEPTLLIDEADTFLHDNAELRGIINSGHTRTTAAVIRTTGEDHEPRQFSTWCAKAIALIGRLQSTLADRSIEIPMRRRTHGERKVPLRQDRIGSECIDLCRQAVRWRNESLESLKNADPLVPHTLNDRAADCYRPLLAIAELAGESWAAQARAAAVALSGDAPETDLSVLLLQDIRQIFAGRGDPPALPTKQIIESLNGLEARPWNDVSDGRPMSAGTLAALLKPFDVVPGGTMRFGQVTAKGYRRAAFEDAWARYPCAAQLSSGNQPSQRNIPNNSGCRIALTQRHKLEECDALESVTSLDPSEARDSVTISAADFDKQVREFVDHFSKH